MQLTGDTEVVTKLREAEKLAFTLFDEAEKRGLIAAGTSERQLNEALYHLAEEFLGIKKFWHKRIVRSGSNTLFPYRENPPDLEIQEDDILFFDFGPVFEDWEADIGKTYVIGSDPLKLKLQRDTELAWKLGRTWYQNHPECTGAEFYQFSCQLADSLGWTFGGEHCGHLIGKFPHEGIEGESRRNYIHPENNDCMNMQGIHGDTRFWIYEIHLVDLTAQIGGFYEAFLGPE